jgi:signal recognition particle subunit SRP54
MTTQERKDPDLLSSSPSRRRRIARGSGYKESDVSKLVGDFQKMRSLMQQMGQGGGFPGMLDLFGGGGGGNPYAAGGRSTPPGWRGYAGGAPAKKKKKEKKKKGFGTL